MKVNAVWASVPGLDWLVTHRMPLNDLDAAMALLTSGVGKALLLSGPLLIRVSEAPHRSRWSDVPRAEIWQIVWGYPDR